MADRHWFDELVERLLPELSKRHEEKGYLVINGGLSVSGLQHIGRLRGEILLGEALRRELEKRGFRVRQLLTLYTMDPWKGKKSQRSQFPDPEAAAKYTGWPLKDVPDPKGCHRNWVEHYWSDFGPYLSEFTDGRIEVVTTEDLYRGELGRLILEEILPKRETVREVINKYRGRKPYPPGWIPVEPRCANCGRIDSTEALRVLDDGRIEYRCKKCGYHGVGSIKDSKLNWRIEWAGVWKVLRVDFEPYGKDHATPGGSRDSCAELARKVLGIEPPLGEWYEWVSIRLNGREADMSSSDFIGITPREWLEIAHPEILRFLYFSTHPHKKVVVDPARIPQYYEAFYRAERVYFGVEEAEDADYLKRTYELSHPREPPESLPAQIPYTHAAILAQIIPPGMENEALSRLKRTGHLAENPDEYSLKRAVELLAKARRWIELYAPPSLRFSVLERIDEETLKGLKYRSVFKKLYYALSSLEEWSEESIRQAMISVGEPLSNRERREFYKEFYRVFVGKDRGPRAAPLLSLLPRDFVLERIKRAAGLDDGGG